MNTQKIFLTILLAVMGWSSNFAQVGIGTKTPSPQSILDLKATDKGLLLPRMTTAQRTSIAPVAVTDDGLEVYDTDTNSIWYWDNGWKEIKNIYDSNGTIAAGRTVGVTDNVNFDSNTFVIDGTNNRVGVGTASPSARLEISSGVANTAGLKFSNFNSSTPVSTGQSIGVDASGHVITLPNPTATTVSTEAFATVIGTSGTDYNVTDLGWTTIPGTSLPLTIPAGGKAVFLNFMLGIDYMNFPSGGGIAYYTAVLYIDGIQTDVFLTAQESGSGTQAQFNLSSVKFLSAGSHTVDVRMRRTFNNSTTSGAVMICRPISNSFNATFLN